MKQQVHLGDGPSAQIPLLAVEGKVANVAALIPDVMRALDQHAAGAACGIADAHTFSWIEQPDDELDDATGSIKFTPFFARVVGKSLDEILIHAPKCVGLGQVGIAETHL